MGTLEIVKKLKISLSKLIYSVYKYINADLRENSHWKNNYT